MIWAALLQDWRRSEKGWAAVQTESVVSQVSTHLTKPADMKAMPALADLPAVGAVHAGMAHLRHQSLNTAWESTLQRQVNLL